MTVEPRGETLVVRPIGPLPEGAYLLSYRVTSVDSHPVGATLRFGVGVEPLPEQGEAPVEQAATRWVGLARWLVYVTALGAAGLALFVQVVRPPNRSGAARSGSSAGRRRPGSWRCCCAWAPPGSSSPGFPARLATGGPWAAVAGTTLAWATAVAALGLALLILPEPRRRLDAPVGRRPGRRLVRAHRARRERGARWLAAPALGVHALCGAFWLASLLPLLWCLRLALTRRTWRYGGSRPRPRPPSSRRSRAPALLGFSSAAGSRHCGRRPTASASPASWCWSRGCSRSRR